jgi:hypothetical protein
LLKDLKKDNIQNKFLYRNSLKQYVYLINLGSNNISKDEKKEKIDKKGGKKKKTQNEDNVNSWKNELIDTFERVLEKETKSLWKHDEPEDSFFLILLNFALSLLENPSELKSKTFKKEIFQLIIKSFKYKEAQGTSTSILNIIMKYEHVSPYITELLEELSKDDNNKLFISEIFKEIGRLDDLGQDSSGTKNLCLFIDNISKNPKIVFLNINLIIIHLNSEVYILRNAIISKF